MQYPVPRTIAFVFICQKGRLEIESLLLAASLKRFLLGEYELIAAVPTPTELLGEPKPRTLETLRKLGVRVATFHNELLEERPSREVRHLLTNKIFSLRIATTADKLVLLDSDQLCRREFFPAQHLRAPLSARKADYVSSRDVGNAWEDVFRAAGVECPTLRICIANPQGEGTAAVYAPPSFNSSFVAIDAPLAADFSRLWEDCFRRIERAGALKQAQYFQEQASLAVAAYKSRIAYEMLDLNSINPCLTHYIHPRRVQTDSQLLEAARAHVRERNEIAEIIREHPEWHFLLP